MEVEFLALDSWYLSFVLQFDQNAFYCLDFLLQFDQLCWLDKWQLSQLIVVQGRIEPFSHKKFDQKSRAANVNGLDAKLVPAVVL